jgi:Tfp pilus assembly protein PilW
VRLVRLSVPAAARQRGLSLVELLIGVAMGLFIVAGVTAIAASQLSDNRKLLLESQIQQDLRASADVIARELRRAGLWDFAVTTVHTTAAPASRNPYQDLSNPSATLINFTYKRGPGQDGPYGFQLVNEVLQSRLGNAGWQDLTDRRSVRITEFSVTTTAPAMAQVACTKLCSDNTTSCWPTVQMREFDVAITGQALTDPAIQRTLRVKVRNRNDRVYFNNAATPSTACPV